MHARHLNGILVGLSFLLCEAFANVSSLVSYIVQADEMGLGKTIQTIAFLAHLVILSRFSDCRRAI